MAIMTAAAWLPTQSALTLEREALLILAGDHPMPTGDEIAAKQHECRCAGRSHDGALALWSRLRWRYLVSIGRAAEYSVYDLGAKQAYRRPAVPKGELVTEGVACSVCGAPGAVLTWEGAAVCGEDWRKRVQERAI